MILIKTNASKLISFDLSTHMEKSETLEELYKRKYDWVPENLKNEIGHFNLFHLQPLIEGQPTSIPYRRRDFYKIMLVKGNSHVHYADRVIEVKNQVLSFSNPQIPYKWEHLDKIREGVYCIFDKTFFHQFGQLSQYEVFQPNGAHLFELSDSESEQVKEIFFRIEKEFNTDYKYKYDVIRNHVFELLHFALRRIPAESLTERQQSNASQRISALFLELLERQFPLDEIHSSIQIKVCFRVCLTNECACQSFESCGETVTTKTTTQLIGERGADVCSLKNSSLSVSQIMFWVYVLTHFDNFFKKYTKLTPLKFRNV